MVRGGIPGETLTATKGFIDLPARKFRPLRQNVGLCERVRLNGDFDGEGGCGWRGCAAWKARRLRFTRAVTHACEANRRLAYGKVGEGRLWIKNR